MGCCGCDCPDTYTYVGPYLKIHNPREKGIHKYFGCAQHHKLWANQNGKPKFCAECGAPLIDYEKEDIDYRFKFNLYGKVDGKLTKVDDPVGYAYEYIIPADRHCYTRSKDSYYSFTDDETSDAVDITPEMISEAIVRFMEDFAEHIKTIVEMVGEVAITYHYGVLIGVE